MSPNPTIEAQFREHIQLAERVLAEQAETIDQIAEAILACYRAGHKAIFCGNGGSAADAQHLAAEFVGRYTMDRRPLPALALHTDTSALTAIANDYAYDEVFARQAQAHLQPGDVLVCLSTSGSSPNVRRAAEVAREQGNQVLGLLGGDGGTIAPLCDVALVVPSRYSFRSQEIYMLAGHIICGIVEQGMFA